MYKSEHMLLKELYSKMRYDLLKPKTIVDYIREAYVYQAGNVRITIDNHINTGLFSKDFFNFNLPTVPMLKDGQIVLEVKYDEFLPTVIRDIIGINHRSSTSISKYAGCRLYG
jgi:hypothetical protein